MLLINDKIKETRNLFQVIKKRFILDDIIYYFNEDGLYIKGTALKIHTEFFPWEHFDRNFIEGKNSIKLILKKEYRERRGRTLILSRRLHFNNQDEKNKIKSVLYEKLGSVSNEKNEELKANFEKYNYQKALTKNYIKMYIILIVFFGITIQGYKFLEKKYGQEEYFFIIIMVYLLVFLSGFVIYMLGKSAEKIFK